MQPGICIRVAVRTDIGKVRDHNEDSYLVVDLFDGKPLSKNPDPCRAVETRGLLLGVCDGMGGAAAGEVASQLAVDVIRTQMCGSPRDDLSQRLVTSVQNASVRIFEKAERTPGHRGMGTTATIAAMMDERVFVAQVGDSRAYLCRDGALMQITRDQTLVEQLVDANQLTRAEADSIGPSNVLVQVVGQSAPLHVDLKLVVLEKGDKLLICSDGLSSMIKDRGICDVLTHAPDPRSACDTLVNAANLAGGHDNVTVIVARREV